MTMKTEIMINEVCNGSFDIVGSDLKRNVICRLCLSDSPSSTTWVSLFGEEALAERLMLLACVQVHEGDGLPSYACRPCVLLLRDADRFRLQCEQSDVVLRRRPDSKKRSGDRNSSNAKEITHSNLKEEADVKCEEMEISFPDVVSDDATSTIGGGYTAEEDEPAQREKKKFLCETCSKPLSTARSLERHRISMHGERSGRAGTVTGYGAGRRFNCDRCPYSTPHSQSLVYHTRVHTGEKPYACEVCPRRFAQPGSLACHSRTHSDRTYFTCTTCGKAFKHRDAYRAHHAVHAPAPYSCALCRKPLKSRKTLAAHMDRHRNVRNFSCETCGVTFVTAAELRNHARKHDTEKRFACHLCDFRSHLKKGLDMHLRRHTGDRPFKCDLCPLACYTRGELKCHTRKHSREKNYACPVCALRFIHSSSVNKHMLKTHGQKYARNDVIDRRTIK